MFHYFVACNSMNSMQSVNFYEWKYELMLICCCCCCSCSHCYGHFIWCNSMQISISMFFFFQSKHSWLAHDKKKFKVILIYLIDLIFMRQREIVVWFSEWYALNQTLFCNTSLWQNQQQSFTFRAVILRFGFSTL